ncbi:MAG: Mth938-like domain-containing protein [Gammaproteobacteria bacterium]
MRFAQDTFAVNSIRDYGRGKITLGDRIITRSAVITADAVMEDWPPQSMAELTAAHLQQLHALHPEIVLLGTGATLQFPPPEIRLGLQAEGIGLEIMATDAACRTFNILLAEERRVVAALMMIEE